MNNDVIKTTKTVTTTGNQQYKRRDRSVSPETAQKISSSLKSYNATHPRGKASDGSEWSKKISDSLFVIFTSINSSSSFKVIAIRPFLRTFL